MSGPVNGRTGGTADPCRLNEQAAAYAWHVLEPDEELALATHLATCPSCRAIVADAGEVATALAESVEQVDPPPRLRRSILDEVGRTPQVGTDGAGPPRAEEHRGAPPRPQRPAPRGAPDGRPAGSARGGGGPGRSRRRRIVAAALALAVLVGVVGVGGITAYTAQRAQDARSQAIAAALAELDGPGTRHATLNTSDGETVGAVVTTPNARMVMTAGLPRNDRDSTVYVLWGVGTSDPQPIGTFDVDRDDAPAPVVHELAPPAGEPSFHEYAISLESGRTAPAAPSTVVASGQMPG